MLKIRKLLLSIPLVVFNIINFSILIESIKNYEFFDYAHLLITLFYIGLSYAVYKEWKYTFLLAVAGYFVCVWLSQTFGYGQFGFFGLHIFLTVLLVVFFEVRKQKR